MLHPEAFLALNPTHESFPHTMGHMQLHDKNVFFCAFKHGQLVGVVKLGAFEQNTAIEFLETSATHRNHGVAKEMLRGLFEHAQAHGIKLTNQGFTEAGKSHLLREISRLESEFPGRFYNIPNM